jgi:acyl transferase domain-containing protein/NAD(P)-dependent dehydrogenase (short-subunit alcohol dehydrogenase family)
MVAKDNETTLTPPVAIISMGCLFPRASGLKSYWRLLYHGMDAITDVPPTHWSTDDYFDEDLSKPDHVYCRRGGFLSPIPFDPTAFGIPPSNLEATDTSQILGLIAAKTALDQAGYGENADFDRDRTAVILGVTGTQELVIPLSARLSWPKWKRALETAGIDQKKTRAIMAQLSSEYVPWRENSFPGLLGNVVAGRICNRLDLCGTNCVVDAACASSMSAINLALMELYTGRSHMVVTGGVDTLSDIFMHMCFARTQILSPTGDARPFSRKADGTVLGEGIGILIMKRLTDAEADGDRILAVLKGIGSSSDGKSQSIYAPRAEGQLKALRKAYAAAEIAPDTINLIEAHGTGTRVGDKIEIEALKKLFGHADTAPFCALGSVKSMIGHTKAAAGAAGLIKTVLALQNKILPPTLKADDPDPDLALEKSPFFLNSQARPWFRTNETPRRAGVSAFGFGGSNFHVVLEEYNARRADVAWDGSIEVIALSETTREALKASFQKIKATLLDCTPEALPHHARKSRQSFVAEQPYRLIVVLRCDEDIQGPHWNTESIFDETEKAFEDNNEASAWQTSSSYFGTGSRPGRLAFVFPGQGSQYLHMGRDLVNWFPEAMETLESADRHFSGNEPLTDFVFPMPLQAKADRQNADDALRYTAVAQPAIGAVSVAMEKILRRFGLAPEATCGHSYGELTALYSAGWIDEVTLHDLSTLRGRLMAEAGGKPGEPNGAMMAVKAPLAELDHLIENEKLDVILANRNSPNQGILSGTNEAIGQAEAVCKTHSYRTVRLPVSAAFHSRLVESAREPFAAALQSIVFQPSETSVYSNTTGEPYPTDPKAIRALLGDHLRNPVNFIGEIEALYADGCRIFIEVGPKTVLTGLVRAILKGRAFHALAMDASNGKKFGVADLAHLLCQLAALGCPITWDEWESREDPPPPFKMRIPITGANYRPPQPKHEPGRSSGLASIATAESVSSISFDPPPATFSKPATPRQLATEEGRPTAIDPLIAGPFSDSNPKAVSDPVSHPNHPVLQALQVVQQGLQSLQSLQAQTVEAHQKFLDTQQQASRTLQEMMESSRRFAEAALNGSVPFTAESSSTAAAAIPPAPPIAAGRQQPQTDMPAPDLRLRQPDPGPEAPQANGHDHVAQTLLAVVSELTGYPVDMLEMDMHIESDLGIDSIKRVEILSKMEETLPALPPVAPDTIASFQTLGQVAEFLAQMPSNASPDATGSSSEPVGDAKTTTGTSDIAAVLREVVSELTGYPAEMLSNDMEIEGDLGIDSIKRVEILSAMEDRLSGFPAIAPDEMAELKTLGQIAARLEAHDPARHQAAPGSSDQSPPLPSGTSLTHVHDALMAVVSELTGYPIEMLSADMEIEADLGIDSIKRVEILSAMEDRLTDFPSIAPDEMAELKTLGQIAVMLTGESQPLDHSDPIADVPANVQPPEQATATLEPPAAQLLRRELTVVDTPRQAGPALTVPDQRKIFITTDKAGLSHALADQLAARGLPTVQISYDILKHRQQLPEAAGLILLCDAEYPGADAPERLKQFLAGAFDLLHHLGPSLQASGQESGAVLATISRMDGTFGVEGLHEQLPYQGGLAGFAKTAAIEWPDVTCRALDIDAKWRDNPAIAREVVEELFHPMPSTPVEIGWQCQRRVTLDLQPASMDDGPQETFALEDGDVVIISGGARGVTAATAAALARQRAMTLILLGRSPAPFPEPDWLKGLESEADFKKAIIANEYAATRPTPQAVQESYHRYRSNREIQHNLASLKEAGADARYVSLDIRDTDKVRAVLNDVRLVHGPIKALVHGAGVLRDRLINDKSAEEFHQVFSTKVEGLENLLAATRTDPLRYIVLFSSVAARFGNIGQVDYAVANEVLNKMAVAEASQRKDCVVRSINWGPWDGGMVTPAHKNAFRARNIALIPMEQGAEAFVSELTAGQSRLVEVVIGSELPSASPSISPPITAEPANSPSDNVAAGLSTVYISELNLERYPILDHHRIDGKPVVPFALIAEWFGHGALHNNPGFQLAGLDAMRLLKGIVLDDHQRPIRVLTSAAESIGDGITVNLELRDGVAAGAEVIHSKATALLTDRLPSAPVFDIPADLRNAAYSRDVTQIYADILFHGHALQGIRRVRGCTPNGMLADLSTAPTPGAWIQKPPRNRWIADPLVMDGAFQMASLWCYEETGRVSLPSFSASYRQYCRRFPGHPVQAVLVVRDVSRHKLVGDFTFIDQDGTVLATMSGYEAVMEDRLIRAFKPERYAAGR